MKTGSVCIWVTFLVALFCTTAAIAADLHVTTAQELQTALSTAASNGAGDTIYIEAGTYVGNFSYVSSESNALIITVETGLNPGQVVLDGNSNGRVLYLNAPGTSTDFTIEKLVVQHGGSTNGAGIYVATNGAFNLEQCTVSHNSSRQGSILSSAGTVFVNNSTFTDNHGNKVSAFYSDSASTNFTFTNNYFARNSSTGKYYLGVVYLGSGASLTFTSNTFEDNQMYGAGCLYANGISPVNITGNVLKNNAATNSVGITIANGSSGTVSNNTLTGNSGGYSTLNIKFRSGTVTVEDNLIADNHANSGVRQGGGYIPGSNAGVLIDASAATVNFNSNIVRDNTAKDPNAGGTIIGNVVSATDNIIVGNVNSTGNTAGIYVQGQTSLDFINNTIYGNSTPANSGGLRIDVPQNSTANIYNNISWGNTAAVGGDVYVTGTGTSRAYFNNFHDVEGLWSFDGNNTDVDPQFVKVSCNDYHLTTGSGCIDSGDNTAPGIPATDLDGNPRIAGAAVDMGAYEHSTAAYHPADANSDWTITHEEYDNYSTAWQNGNSWPSGPNPIPIDYVTRAGFLQQQSSGQYHNNGGGEPLCWVTGSSGL